MTTDFIVAISSFQKENNSNILETSSSLPSLLYIMNIPGSLQGTVWRSEHGIRWCGRKDAPDTDSGAAVYMLFHAHML